MAKRYKAIYLPDEDCKVQLDKGGFESRQDAEDYIASQRCDACQKYWKNREECSCRAEWDIEEYDDAA